MTEAIRDRTIHKQSKTMNVTRLPSVQMFKNLPIGAKLSMSFGLLAALTIIVVGLILLLVSKQPRISI